MPNLVSNADLGLYLNNPDIDDSDARATFIIGLAETLCKTIVDPLPTGANLVILDVAERAYANPTPVGAAANALYSEGVGPYSTTTPGTTGGGLYLTANNEKTLRRLAGQTGGAFTIDMLPADLPALPPWDTGNDIALLDLP